MRTRALAVTSLGLVALFVVWTVLTATGHVSGLDHDVARAVARHTSHAADVAFSAVALLVSGLATVVWVLVLVAVGLVRPRLRAGAAAVVVALVAVDAVEVLLKAVVDHPGPARSRTVGALALGPNPVTSGSFPSGHMVRALVLAFGAAALVSAPARRRAALATASVLCLVIAWTRVYLNDHWTSDVVGAALLGAACIPPVVLVARRGRPAARSQRMEPS